jgi:hypothetical protein
MDDLPLRVLRVLQFEAYNLSYFQMMIYSLAPLPNSNLLLGVYMGLQPQK